MISELTFNRMANTVKHLDVLSGRITGQGGLIRLCCLTVFGLMVKYERNDAPYDANGNRLYLNAGERAAFLAVAQQRKPRSAQAPQLSVCSPA